jgi:hypothetical protein
MTLNPREFLKTIKNRMDFDNNDQVILTSYADWGKTIAPEMADYFYNYLGNDEEMNAIINAVEGRVQRLHHTFIEWFGEMFTGIDDWGDTYADRRWRIGLIHVRIGIGPQHVVPAMATVVREVSKKLNAEGKRDDLRDSLAKICMIDLAFIEQAYVEVSSTAVLQETGWTEGLFRRLIVTGAGGVK